MKKIFESYFRDRLTFSNIRSRSSRRIYRLALPRSVAVCRPDLTSRMQNWKEVNVWSSTVYSCDFHEGRQHLITLLKFVLNFVLFFILFTRDFHEGRQYFFTLLMLVLNFAF